jgi:preprotein translocase subunit SecA
VSKTNSEIANFLLTAQLPKGQQEIRQPQAARPAEQPKVQISKAESMNLNERAAIASRQGSPSQGAGPAMPPPAPQRIDPVKAEIKIGRNDACPCGSGKKYKQCHGKESE